MSWEPFEPNLVLGLAGLVGVLIARLLPAPSGKNQKLDSKG